MKSNEIRYLINEDRNEFDSGEIADLKEKLDSLDDNERESYRNNNATAIAECDADRLLIVSGPGTGKSHLFLERIRHWLKRDEHANITIISFVGKLVAGLQSDVNNKLTKEEQSRVEAFTLHKLAKSIIQKSISTIEFKSKSNIGILDDFWQKIIWEDTLENFEGKECEWLDIQKELYNNSQYFDGDKCLIRNYYLELCQYLKAVSFIDLILNATQSLKENPELNKSNYFIIDEYQDFNLAEEALIKELTAKSEGLFIVGDDDQVLYDFKESRPKFIREMYRGKDYAIGMLPYCGRSSFNIVKGASHFLSSLDRRSESIDKIYLPICTTNENSKISIVGCPSPSSATTYIEEFMIDNKKDIEERANQLELGKPVDSYLLILTPAKSVSFYKKSKPNIFELIEKYKRKEHRYSKEYNKFCIYYSLSKNLSNNFLFRKLLYYEEVSTKRVHEIIQKGLQDKKDLCKFIEYDEIEKILEKCRVFDTTITETQLLLGYLMSEIEHKFSDFDINSIRKDFEYQIESEKPLLQFEYDLLVSSKSQESETQAVNAIDLLTIQGSKGLSADHIFIIGFDDVNMRVTENAFYVAITRARKSIHIITACKSGGSNKSHDFLSKLSDSYLEFLTYTKSDPPANKLKRLASRNEFIMQISKWCKRYVKRPRKSSS